MKITIIVEDNVVIIDGKPIIGIDLSFLKKKNISAVQWNGSEGEVEYSDGKGNEKITSMDAYKKAISSHKTKLKSTIESELSKKPSDPFYVWDDSTIKWVVDEEARIAYYESQKIAFRKTARPSGCHKWDTSIQDWILDEMCLQIDMRKKYLNETDWYYVRKLETGEDVPSDIAESRKQAREFLRLNDSEKIS